MLKKLAMVVFGLALMGQGCFSRPAPISEDPMKVGKGVSLSPQSFAEEHFLEFFDLALEGGTLVSWVGSHTELQNENGAHKVVASQGYIRGYQPVIIFAIRDVANASEMERDAFYKQLEAFAKEAKPAYIGIGNEINYYLKDSSGGLPPFSDMFVAAQERIRSVSPKTKVFPVFQYETMKGLRGGLFGGTNDESKNQWYMLRAFNSADMIGFTSYPGLIYQNPSDIPDDYYNEIREYTGKPIVFTETGWFREGPASGWESSAEEQAEFIHRWFGLTDFVDPQFVIWSFMYDPEIDPPFKTMGLIPDGENTSAAWEAWKSARLDN